MSPPDRFPELYKVRTTAGDCLGPTFPVGTVWSVSSLESPNEGDIVALWLAPGLNSDGSQGDGLGHRVARGEACIIKILFSQDSDSITVLTLNPIQMATIPRSHIVAMHRVFAVQTPAGLQRLLRGAA